MLQAEAAALHEEINLIWLSLMITEAIFSLFCWLEDR